MNESASAKSHSLGKHAAVIGGSFGGLLAARVLADYFEKVTILERDAIPVGPEPRKGVPQGRHVHTLFGGGANVVERLLPGFFEELVADGAIECDFSKDLCWYHQGVWKLRTDIGLTSYWQSRPFLEAHVRRRVKNLPNIDIVEQCGVGELLASEDKGRITGLNISRRGEGGSAEVLPADFVVDCGGRGSKTPQWLEALGYQKPDETTVEIDLSYSSRIYQRPPDDERDWQVLAVYGTPPDGTRTGYIFPIEGQRWLVTEVGYFGDHPPDDDEGFLEFARSMELPDIYQAIKDAEPLTSISTYRFPAHRRRRYERLSRLPEGFVVLGDAACSFSPVYGQGMSACALEVDALDTMLDQHAASGGIPTGFPKRFYKKISRIIDNPWLLATNADFLFPRTAGQRPFGTALLNWYVVGVLELCARKERVLRGFVEVLHFIKQPAALFHPLIAFHVLTWKLGLKALSRPSHKRPQLST